MVYLALEREGKSVVDAAGSLSNELMVPKAGVRPLQSLRQGG